MSLGRTARPAPEKVRRPLGRPRLDLYVWEDLGGDVGAVAFALASSREEAAALIVAHVDDPLMAVALQGHLNANPPRVHRRPVGVLRAPHYG